MYYTVLISMKIFLRLHVYQETSTMSYPEFRLLDQPFKKLENTLLKLHVSRIAHVRKYNITLHQLDDSLGLARLW